jgi:hypothetical protein
MVESSNPLIKTLTNMQKDSYIGKSPELVRHCCLCKVPRPVSEIVYIKDEDGHTTRVACIHCQGSK